MKPEALIGWRLSPLDERREARLEAHLHRHLELFLRDSSAGVLSLMFILRQDECLRL